MLTGKRQSQQTCWNRPRYGSDPAWKRLAGTEPDDSCTPACFRIGSIWPQPDMAIQNQIGSGPVAFCQNRASSVLRETGPMILAHRLASRPDPFGHDRTWPSRVKSDSGRLRFARTGPVAFCQNRAGSVLPEQGRLRFARTRPVPFCQNQAR